MCRLTLMSNWSTWCCEKQPNLRFRWQVRVPEVGANMSITNLSNVVLPAPFSPTYLLKKCMSMDQANTLQDPYFMTFFFKPEVPALGLLYKPLSVRPSIRPAPNLNGTRTSISTSVRPSVRPAPNLNFIIPTYISNNL